MRTHNVFVYGTLKKGQPNYAVLSESEGKYTFLGKSTTQEKFPLVVGTTFNIPFILNNPGEGHNIRGEVYEVDDTKLHILDELEAHPHLYERKLNKVYIAHIARHPQKEILLVDALPRWSSKLTQKSYVREKLMKNEETNLFKEIIGYDPRPDDCQVGVGRRHDQ